MSNPWATRLGDSVVMMYFSQPVLQNILQNVGTQDFATYCYWRRTAAQRAAPAQAARAARDANAQVNARVHGGRPHSLLVARAAELAPGHFIGI